MTTNNEREKLQNIQMNDFLLNTLVELKVTLSKMASDSDEKTDILHDVTDSLTAIVYSVQEFKDRLANVEETNSYILKELDVIKNKLSLIEVKAESEGVAVEGHVREIKYAIQQIKDLGLTSKPNPPAPAPKPDDKQTWLSHISDIVEAIKNVRLIFIIALTITLIVGALINGGAKPIIDIIKAVTGIAQ